MANITLTVTFGKHRDLTMARTSCGSSSHQSKETIREVGG